MTAPDPIKIISVKGHDLATPLTTINGILEFLDKTLADSRVPDAKWIRILKKESRRMAVMIQDLLLYSAMERNALRYAFTDTDLTALLKETVRADSLGARASVAFMADKQSDAVGIIADKEKLSRAFEYILDALTHRTQPGETVSVRLRKRGSRIIITFLAPSRTDSISSEDGPGSDQGFGLYISERIIRSHKGELVIRQTPKKGKEITVMLTAVKQKGGYV